MLEGIEIHKMEARLIELNSLLEGYSKIRYERDMLVKQIQAYQLWSRQLRPNQLLTITQAFMDIRHIKEWKNPGVFRLGGTITLVSMTNTKLCYVELNERVGTSSIPIEIVQEMANEYRRRNCRAHIEIDPVFVSDVYPKDTK